MIFAQVVRGEDGGAWEDIEDRGFDALEEFFEASVGGGLFGFHEDKDGQVGWVFFRPSFDLREAVFEERTTRSRVKARYMEDIELLCFLGPVDIEFKLAHPLFVELFGQRGVGVVPDFYAVVGGDVVAVVGPFDLDVIESQGGVERVRRGGGLASREEQQASQCP